MLIAVVLILLCLCSAGLFLFKGLRRRQRDEAEACRRASQARKASVPNPEFMSATNPSMKTGAVWEQGTNVTNVDATSSTIDDDVYVATEVVDARRSSAASITSTTSADSTAAATVPRPRRQRKMTDWGDSADAEARRNSDSAMSVSSAATDWGDGADDGLVVKPLAMSGTAQASLVSNQSVFGDDPYGNGGTLSRMHEPIREGSEMLDGVPVACLATDATAEGSLFSAERAHQPDGEQNLPSGTRTAVNSTYQPQAPVIKPGRTTVNPSYQSQVPRLERDDPAGNGDACVEVDYGGDHYLEVESDDTRGSDDTYVEVVPDEGPSAYGTLGINTSRPASSSGGMYASLGVRVPSNTTAANAIDKVDRPAAVRFDGNGADYDYEVLPTLANVDSNYDYQILSVDGTPMYGTADSSAGRPVSDAVYAKLGATTAAGSTCPAPTQPAAAGGGARLESEDMCVELGATASTGSTGSTYASEDMYIELDATASTGSTYAGIAPAAVMGKAGNEYAALISPPAMAPVDKGALMEQQLSGTGAGPVYDLETAGYDSPAAPVAPVAPIYKGIESEKQLSRLRAATSSPDCEGPTGQPMYAEPTYNVVQNHYEGVPPLAAVGPANGLGPAKLAAAAAAGDPDPTYATPAPLTPRSGVMPSAGGSVRGFAAPQYSEPPEYVDPDQDDPEYAAVDDSAPVPAASEFTYTDMVPPRGDSSAHVVDDDEAL